MKVAIYARVSTKDKQQVDNQLRDLRKYCKAQGYTIYKEYIDKETGANPYREYFKQLFVDASQRKYDLLLFWALDRFTREGAGATINYLNQLERLGIGFKSYTEQYLDSSGIFKVAIISILATLAKQERVRMSERVKAGLSRARAEGKKLGQPEIASETVDAIKYYKKNFNLSNRKIAGILSIDGKTVGKYLNM